MLVGRWPLTVITSYTSLTCSATKKTTVLNTLKCSVNDNGFLFIFLNQNIVKQLNEGFTSSARDYDPPVNFDMRDGLTHGNTNRWLKTKLNFHFFRFKANLFYVSIDV